MTVSSHIGVKVFWFCLQHLTNGVSLSLAFIASFTDNTKIELELVFLLVSKIFFLVLSFHKISYGVSWYGFLWAYPIWSLLAS